MSRFNKKTKIAIVTAALVFGVSGTAFAYWTQMGAGTGTAGTGTTVAVVVNQTNAAITDLYPGGPARALSGTFNNPNAAAVTVGAVTATITTSAPGTCLSSWYTITGSSTPVTQVLAAGTAVGSWSGLNVALTNNALNQDACKGATVTFAYTVAAG